MDKQRGTLTFVKLSAAQILAILAAVDYEHVSDQVCCYVYEWEVRTTLHFRHTLLKPTILTPRVPQNDQLENSYSDPEPIPTLHHEMKDYPRPNPLFRLNSPAAPVEEDDIVVADSAPDRRVSSAGTKRGKRSKKLAVSIPQSNTNGPANFYNADKNEYLHLDIDPNIDALDDVVPGNVFPLLPPSFLSEKHKKEYAKRIGRMSLPFPLHPSSPTTRHLSSPFFFSTD